MDVQESTDKLGGVTEVTPQIADGSGAEPAPETVEGAPETVADKISAIAEKGKKQAAQKTKAPAYEVNKKYKVHDKELEFDDWVLPVIKDAEMEKKVRELYEKAMGIDHVKADRQTLRDENIKVTQELSGLKSSLQQLSQFVQKGDLHSFFEGVGIPEEQVLRYALERVQYRELSPEQRQQYEYQRSLTRQQYEKDAYISQMEEQYKRIATQARETELGFVLQRPDVAEAVKAFDARAGKPGAFRDEVIRRGQFYAFQGQDIPAEQAVKEILSFVGAVTPAQPGVQASQPSPQAQVISAQREKPVIPNIQGRGTSPAKKIPRSIDDLNALYKETLAGGE